MENYKTILNNYCQRYCPVNKPIIKAEKYGTDHQPYFTVKVQIDNKVYYGINKHKAKVSSEQVYKFIYI